MDVTGYSPQGRKELDTTEATEHERNNLREKIKDNASMEGQDAVGRKVLYFCFPYYLSSFSINGVSTSIR